MKRKCVTKNRNFRKRLAIILATTTLLTGCGISSGNTGTSAINQEALKYAYAYDKHEKPQDFPNEMIELFAKYKVVMAGEMHYVKEHQEMITALIQRLHESGFRYYLSESGDSRGFIIDGYIKGKINTIKEEQLKMDEIAIEALKRFNEQLRAENRAEEQINYISFDINHSDTEYYNAIDVLAEHFQSEALKNYKRDLTAAKMDSYYEYKKIVDAFLVALDNPNDANNANNPYNKLDSEQIGILKEMTEAERVSFELRSNMSLSAREDFIYSKVNKAIKRLKDDEKLFISVGMTHAQYVKGWESGITKGETVEWLAMRLKKDFSNVPYGLYNFAVTTYKGVFKNDLRDPNHESYVLEAKEKDAFLKVVHSTYGSKNVFIDFTPLVDRKEKMIIHYPFTTTTIEPNVQFNGLLVYPEMTVAEGCTFYEQ